MQKKTTLNSMSIKQFFKWFILRKKQRYGPISLKNLKLGTINESTVLESTHRLINNHKSEGKIYFK